MLPPRICQFFVFAALLAHQPAFAAESHVRRLRSYAGRHFHPARLATLSPSHCASSTNRTGILTGSTTAPAMPPRLSGRSPMVSRPAPSSGRCRTSSTTRTACHHRQHGHEGETFLSVEITPPATLKPGDTFYPSYAHAGLAHVQGRLHAGQNRGRVDPAGQRRPAPTCSEWSCKNRRPAHAATAHRLERHRRAAMEKIFCCACCSADGKRNMN